MEFFVHLQVIVRRAKNAISFSTFDYSESEQDPESLRQAKLRAEQIEMEKEWSSTDAESPPRTPSRKRVRRVGSAPEHDEAAEHGQKAEHEHAMSVGVSA